MWFYPLTILKAELTEAYFDYTFEGSIKAFKQLTEGGVTIHRRVKKMKGSPEWVITDTIEGAPADIVKRQLWHIEDSFKSQDSRYKLKFESDGEKVEKEGWNSDYYGEKHSINQFEILTKENEILTKIILKG